MIPALSPDQALGLAIAGAIVMALGGGLWRRAFGGWLGLSRVMLTCLGVVMTAPAFLAFPWWQALIVAAGYGWLWTDGHKFFPATWNPLGYRYLAPAATIAALTAQPVFLAIGPLVFAGYWLTEHYWPEHWRIGGFIDGTTSAGEIFAGMSAYGVLGTAMILAFRGVTAFQLPVG